MAFRSDRQISEVCVILTSKVGGGTYWTTCGPTKLASKRGLPLSSGESIMLRVAWAMWNQDSFKKVTLGELLTTLDGPNLRLVGSLLVAIACDANAIDLWIDQHRHVVERTRRLPALAGRDEPNPHFIPKRRI